MSPPSRRLLRRLLPALLGGLLLLVVAFAALIWSALAGSEPQLEGRVAAAGLDGETRIERDAAGNVSIEAASRLDASYALGFVHAQERFFEMDLARRVAAGELSALVGAAALDTDLKNRHHRFRARAEQNYAGSPAADRAELDRYRDGVNAGLAALRVRPWEYLLLRVAPLPWRSEDTLLVADAMFLDLNGGNEDELRVAQMHAALPAGWTEFITAADPEWEAPLQGDPGPAPQLPTTPLPPSSQAAALNLPDVAFADRDAMPGSNNFAVAGSLTDSGAAIVSNDMHLGLRAPNLWFRARIRYPDATAPGGIRELNGVTLPGAPTLVAGSNGRIAWGYTNSYGDWMDWVRVLRDPADMTRYQVPEGWATIERHVETIQVHGAPDHTLVVEDTRWGPIAAEDVDGTPLALAWTAYLPRANNLRLMALEQVDTVSGALDLAPTLGMPPQNFTVGDTDGHIGWTLTGNAIPLRAGFDPALPADWSKPGSGWVGFAEARDFPRIENPPEGRLWTANNRTVGGDWLRLLGDGGHAHGARALTIRDDLRARQHFAPADSLAIQLDDRARLLDRWQVLLRKTLSGAPADDAGLQALSAATAHWGGHATVDSVDYRIVRSFRDRVGKTLLAPVLAVVQKHFADFELPHRSAEAAVWTLVSQQPPQLLDPKYADWNALLLDCARQVATELSAEPGGIAASRWGDHNRAAIRHPLSVALPAFIGRWLDMPADALAGDTLVPRVTAPRFGSSERFDIMPGHEDQSLFEMPGGQSDHPLSPFHGAGHEDWVQGRPTSLLPGATAHRLLLVPG